jgi:hypothetical protein
LIIDFEFDQHLGSHKHVINITMWFRDMGCYSGEDLVAAEVVAGERGAELGGGSGTRVDMLD